MALPPEGWYLDPNDSALVRWWTGAAWSEHSQPVAARTAAPSVVPSTALSATETPFDSTYVPMGRFEPATKAPVLTGRAARVENERQARKNNVFAWTGLLMGVISFLFNPFAVPSILAIVFASIGLGRAQRLSDAGSPFTGRGTAVAGLVIGILVLGFSAYRLYLSLDGLV